jgi:hypothetical protein
MHRDEKKKYALEPLRRVREEAERHAKEELARAVQAREEATRARAAGEAERDAALRRAESLRAQERERLAQGVLSAADLARQDAWEAGARAARVAAESRVRELASREAAAAEAENLRRSDLGARMRDLELVEKDKERWEEARRARGEAVDEAEGADAWRPKRA